MIRIALFVLLLAGCAAQGGWEKSGSTDHDFHVDRGQCIAQMESVSFASNMQKARVFAGCMQGKGWYWVEK